jgi:hypothetical protein
MSHRTDSELRSSRRLRGILAALSAPALGLALLAGGIDRALAQQASGAAPADNTGTDQMDLGSSQADAAAKSGEKRSPFIEETKVGAQLRTFYFYRDQYSPAKSEAWALGGSAWVRTGYVNDLVRFGAVAYTSQPLYAPDDRDGTLLLAPGQEGYTVLGQAYAEVKFNDRMFGAIGRKEYDTPYLNKNDFRMTPNTFEGITVYGTSGGKAEAPQWRFGGGYISKIKERNSDEFVWLSRDAGASVDRGVLLGGANYTQNNWSLGAIEYYSEDILSIFYADLKYTIPLAGGNSLLLGGQFSDQRSNGDNLLTGSSFSTSGWGVKADWRVSAATLTAAYTDTASGADLRSPWGVWPGYTSIQVTDFNRAGEGALLLKAAYDFSRSGPDGLTGYMLLARGSGRDAPAFNETEYDFDLQWRPKGGKWKGTWVRVRYAHVDQQGGGDPTVDDFRVIVNYDF